MDSIAAQDFPPQDYEIIVVSNFDDPEARQAALARGGAFTHFQYHELGRPGVNPSRNFGLERARGDVVVFLDDDCRLDDKDYLKRVVALHAKYSDATAIGGVYELTPKAGKIASAYHSIGRDWMGVSGNVEIESWRLVGGNVSYKRDLLVRDDATFDSEFIFGGAETELHERLKARGHRAIAVGSLRVNHDCQINLAKLCAKALHQGIGAGRLHLAGVAPLAKPKRIFAGRGMIGVWVWIYDWFFEAGIFLGRKGETPGKGGRAIWARAVREFGFQKLRASAVFMLAQRGLIHARVLAIKTYWLFVGQVVWRLKAHFRGIYVLLVHWSPDPWLGAKPKTPSLAARYLTHYVKSLKKKGSRTSSFLHSVWNEFVVPSAGSAVHIPASRNDEKIFERARLVKGFGFDRIAFAGDLLEHPRASRVCWDLREAGFEIDLYYQASQLDEESVSLLANLRQLGVATLPVFDSATLEQVTDLPERFGLGPDVEARQLVGLATRPRASDICFTYVDFLGDGGFQPRRRFQFACETAVIPELKGLRWRQAEIIQPFSNPDAPDRLRVGVQVWSNGVSVANPEWSVVIPCFENAAYLPSVIEHLFAQNYSIGSIEVIVVDDGSEAPIHEALGEELKALKVNPRRALKVMRIDRGAEHGDVDKTFRAGLARNAGILASQGRKILFLDSDILVPRDHFRKLDDALKHSGLVQSMRYMLKERASNRETKAHRIDLVKDTYREDHYWESFKRVGDWNKLAAPWKYVCTYALAIRREDLAQVKFFRPEFAEYGFEDTELGFRLFRQGIRFHLLKSPVFHLYPLRESWTVHFDETARFQTLSRTAQLFYRMHGDPSIFYELRTYLDRPMELK